ncbi:MAG: UPF0262 family protein, partial [Paracoccaceae bacterium]
MTDTNRLVHVEIDETGLPAPTPEIDQERRVAIFDLIEEICLLDAVRSVI